MRNGLFLSVFVFLLIGISLASAVPQTMVVGKIYDQVYGGAGLPGVSISISCGTDSWAGTSLTNGDYAASINRSECNNTNTMNIILSRSGYNDGNYDSNGTIKTMLLGSDELLVVNFYLTNVTVPPYSSSGRSSGGSRSCTSTFWDCNPVWSECLSGSQSRVCSSNCGTDRVETQGCIVESESEEVIDLGESSADVTMDDEPNGFFSAITGAVIGGGATSVAVAGGFLVLVLGGFLLIRVRKKRLRK